MKKIKVITAVSAATLSTVTVLKYLQSKKPVIKEVNYPIWFIAERIAKNLEIISNPVDHVTYRNSTNQLRADINYGKQTPEVADLFMIDNKFTTKDVYDLINSLRFFYPIVKPDFDTTEYEQVIKGEIKNKDIKLKNNKIYNKGEYISDYAYDGELLVFNIIE